MGLRFELPEGVATVIGSLPFERVADAAQFMLDELPGLPAAPAVELDEHRLEPGQLDPDLGEALAGFLTRLGDRAEPVIMTLTGPVTLSQKLVGSGMRAEAATEVARDAVAETGRWMLATARRTVPGTPVLVFLQESALVHSLHPAFPVTPIEVADRLADVVGSLSALSTDVVVGVQVPGPADWSRLFDTGIGAVAAPLSAHLERATDEVAGFLERDGVIAWGAVPTDEPLGVSADRLWRRLSGIFAELTRAGADPRRLREHSLITPSGSLVGFGLPQLERVIDLTRELAQRSWDPPSGDRLTVVS